MDMCWMESLLCLYGFNLIDDWMEAFFIVDKKLSSGNRIKDHVYHDVVNR